MVCEACIEFLLIYSHQVVAPINDIVYICQRFNQLLKPSLQLMNCTFAYTSGTEFRDKNKTGLSLDSDIGTR
jgi:hypothetical protein